MNGTPGGISSSTSSLGGGTYSLKWNQFESCMSLGLAELLEDEEYSMTDVTLACEGEFIEAHKIALAMSSPFFKQFFKMNRVEKAGITLIALANVKFKDLKNIIHFIYHGQVELSNVDLTDFLAAANLLKIRGLEQSTDNSTSEFKATPTSSSRGAAVRSAPPVSSDLSSTAKRPRLGRLSPAPTDIDIIPQVPVSLPSVVSAPVPPSSSLDDYSSMHSYNQGEGEEEDEAMISYDEVKVENIAVYTVDDHQQDVGSYQDLTGDSSHSNTETVTGCDKIDISYPEPSFPIIIKSVSSSSTEPPKATANSSQRSGTRTRPSTRASAPRKPPASSSNELQLMSEEDSCNSNDLSRTHGDGGQYFDAETQKVRYSCLCGTTFSQKASLYRHMVEMDTTVICTRCNKEFHRMSNLTLHQTKGKCSGNRHVS